MSDPTPNPRVQVTARVQITTQFPAGRKDNDKWPDLSDSGRRQVQRAVALYLRDHFPHNVRDDWNAFTLTVDRNGNLGPAETRTTIENKVADQRLHATLPDLGVDPNTQTVIYNVHDNVQCTSVSMPLIKKATGAPIKTPILVQDPALPNGSGEIEPVFVAELKWEVPLGDATE